MNTGRVSFLLNRLLAVLVVTSVVNQTRTLVTGGVFLGRDPAITSSPAGNFWITQRFALGAWLLTIALGAFLWFAPHTFAPRQISLKSVQLVAARVLGTFFLLRGLDGLVDWSRPFGVLSPDYVEARSLAYIALGMVLIAIGIQGAFDGIRHKAASWMEGEDLIPAEDRGPRQ